jgi:sulfate permease, SulP family
MALQYQFDDISLMPIKNELSNYSWPAFRQDMFAAFSVTMLTIPQAMAYALLAGLPISCGIFAAIFSSMVAAFFGSSRHLIVGPSTAIAILLQSATSEVMFTYYRHLVGEERELMAVMILSQLVLLTSILQLAAAICKLGRLIQFVSHSVIVGYVTGTALAIFINQMFPFLGIQRATNLSSFYERGSYLITHLHQIHMPSAIIGLISIGLIIGLKRFDKRVPSAFVTFAVMGAVVYFFDLAVYSEDGGWANPYEDEVLSQVLLVGDVGKKFDFIPLLSYPYFDTGIMNELLPVAFALALLSIMETTTISKSIAASSGQRLSTNQEIFGVGLGNFVSSFIGALPISGSSIRTIMSYNNGAQTRIAAILNTIFSGIIASAFGFMIVMIPLSTLAALLLITAANIVNPKQFFLCLKATSSDAFVLWITVLSCIFFSLDIALYIGVAISVILYLKKAAIPQLKEYDIDDSGELVNLCYGKPHEYKPIRVIKVEGELFFGAADLFQTTLKAFAEDDNSTKVIVLQLKNARDIDATACLALYQLHDYLTRTGRYLIACGLTPQIWEVLSDSGFVEVIGKENLFIFDETHPHLYMQKAIHRAKQLLMELQVKPPHPEIEPSKDPLILSTVPIANAQDHIL